MSGELQKSQREHALICAKVKELIELVRPIVYLPEYQQKTPDEEVLGVAVAKYCDWTSDRILRTFSSALEDANFASLSAKVDSWFK